MSAVAIAGFEVCATFTFDSEAGSYPSGGVSIGNVRLPTDPIGNHALTLTNLVIGSNIQLERSGTGLEFRQATSSTEVFTIPVYSSGNDVFIKVRKASSAPYYRSYETQMTATVGSSSIYVSQIPDE